MLPISWIILMWHKYNPWRDNVSHHFSVNRSRSHRPFKFLQSSILLDYLSTISSYCWRKEGFRPSMNVSWDFRRWHCWGINCWSCIYCLNVPCYKRYNLIKRNYLVYLKNLTLKRSRSGSNFLSTHIHFFPCESTLPFLRYGCFKIWPWKFNVKVRLEVKGQGTRLAQEPFDDLFITPQPSGLEGYCRHGPGGRAAAKLAEPISL